MVEFSIGGQVVIAGSRILVPVAIASVLPGVQMQVYGTVSTSGGATAATVTVATVQAPVAVGTVQSPVQVHQDGGGTVVVATVQSPVPVTGTLLASGTITESQIGATPTYVPVSATIVVGGGTLYGVVVANTLPPTGTIGGTLVLYHSFGQQIAIVVPPGRTGGFMLDRGMAFSGSLVATLLGLVNVTVMH